MNRGADAISRAGCSCPYPARGYRPLPEAERPEQEVPLGGGEWWRGRTCPGAIIERDPLVALTARTYNPLVEWGQVPWIGGWPAAPVWWVEAIQEVHAVMAAIDREEQAPHG